MLTLVGPKGEYFVAACDCAKQHSVRLADTTETPSGYSFAPIICDCGAKHVMSRGKTVHPAEIERLAVETKSKSVLVVSLPAAYGYQVLQHFDLISCEIVLGTGFLSEWNAAVADFWGTRSDRFEGKLAQAKALAIKELKIKAVEVGANAIIGADIDYHSVSTNLLMVVVTGTPVVLELS
ncbi:MAG: heavy metal-binding domain-containing protein [Peptococcaceae bacterium]|nr:heavy metal-binding domain-containing protein [Peptococcaceae bacterium]